jgi:hypothetical protein
MLTDDLPALIASLRGMLDSGNVDLETQRARNYVAWCSLPSLLSALESARARVGELEAALRPERIAAHFEKRTDAR